MAYQYRLLLAILSGLLFAFIFIYMALPCAFTALVPLIIALHKLPLKKSIVPGLLCGLTIGSFSSSWMLESLAAFASTTTAVFIYTLSVLLIGLMMLLGSILLYPFINNRLPFIVKSIGIASTWTLFEWFIGNSIPGAFWFHPNLFKGVLKSELLIQVAAFGGGWLVSFFCAWINAALALCLLQKSKQTFIWLLSLCSFFTGLSYLVSGLYHPTSKNNETAKVALINANHPLHMQWNEQTGDRVVQEMLRLNAAAYATGSALHIWTEAIVPWSFRKDDDFLQALLKNPGQEKKGHIIGMLTDYAPDTYYNSAYYIEALNDTVQRYDKQFPLMYSEAPLTLFSVPLAGSPGFNIKAGQKDGLFRTLAGKAGITICNESLIPKASRKLARDGAEFLMIISNDGWIANSYLAQQHFYSARLQAVESRRDVLINSNSGYSGGFNSMGKELARQKETVGFVLPLFIRKNTTLSFYSKNYHFFIYVYLFLTVLLSIILITQTFKRRIA
ncbi:MAG: apolipoprotein N-acyltransferase [Sphingobacteriales bacterium]|nr:MAG: apolipoprotein N-acyltransferase [Sphingobacteriales bacterium]